jgi:hypothetical protein
VIGCRRTGGAWSHAHHRLLRLQRPCKEAQTGLQSAGKGRREGCGGRGVGPFQGIIRNQTRPTRRLQLELREESSRADTTRKGTAVRTDVTRTQTRV